MATNAAVAEKKLPPKKRYEVSSYLFRLTSKDVDFATGTNEQRVYIKKVDNIYWAYVNGKPVDMLDDNFDPSTAEDVEWRQRKIRYVFGERTIFVDEQEKDGRWQNDDPRLLNTMNSDHLVFQKRELRVDGHDKPRLMYLWCMSQCENINKKARPYTRNAPLFKLIDHGQLEIDRANKVAEKEKAYELAKSVRKEELWPHAAYLGISLVFPDSVEERDFDLVKSDYVDFALTKPEVFLKSFSDPLLKNRYKIKKLIDETEITLLKVQGQAHWVESGKLITDIPPDKAPIEHLAEFAITKDGSEFANNLRSFK